MSERTEQVIQQLGNRYNRLFARMGNHSIKHPNVGPDHCNVCSRYETVKSETRNMSVSLLAKDHEVDMNVLRGKNILVMDNPIITKMYQQSEGRTYGANFINMSGALGSTQNFETYLDISDIDAVIIHITNRMSPFSRSAGKRYAIKAAETDRKVVVLLTAMRYQSELDTLDMKLVQDEFEKNGIKSLVKQPSVYDTAIVSLAKLFTDTRSSSDS